MVAHTSSRSGFETVVLPSVSIRLCLQAPHAVPSQQSFQLQAVRLPPLQVQMQQQVDAQQPFQVTLERLSVPMRALSVRGQVPTRAQPARIQEPALSERSAGHDPRARAARAASATDAAERGTGRGRRLQGTIGQERLEEPGWEGPDAQPTEDLSQRPEPRNVGLPVVRRSPC